MADLIEREKAIDALAANMPSLTTPDGSGQFDHDIHVVQETYVDCMQIIHELPSAQPEQDDKSFEEMIHAMFDHIWECEIDHPIFQDTVGQLMTAVIQCHKNLMGKKSQPEQKVGKWESQKGGGYKCSECGRYALDEIEGSYVHVAARTPYCPFCGKKMEGSND